MNSEINISQKVFLDDIEISNISDEQLVVNLQEYLDSEKNVQIITFNTDHYRIYKNNTSYRKCCQEADLILPDGIGIILLIKKKYKVVFNRLTGNKILLHLLKLADENEFKITFVGSSKQTQTELKSKLYNKFKNIKAQFLSPSQYFEEKNELNKLILDEIIDFKPDILVVALGCPRQELWINEHKEKIGASISIGIGAALDFYSGTKKRAPKIVQKIGFEWIWRLFQEPRRLWRRYLIFDFPFFVKSYLSINRNV